MSILYPEPGTQACARLVLSLFSPPISLSLRPHDNSAQRFVIVLGQEVCSTNVPMDQCLHNQMEPSLTFEDGTLVVVMVYIAPSLQMVPLSLSFSLFLSSRQSRC